MRSRRLIALLASLLVPAICAAPAAAAPTIGVADQAARIFDDPLFTALDTRITRVIVSYDAIRKGGPELENLDVYIPAALAAGVDPLVAFNAPRGHKFGRTSDLPSVKRYTSAIKAFRKRFPRVKTYSAWNEINHYSQPTFRNPTRAAQFTNALAKACRGCRIVAADLLDQAGASRYLARFKRALKVKAKIWGLHNYSDTNRSRSKGTKEFLRATRRGEVWLTETGGVVKFGKSFPYSPSRAARSTRYAFKLARSNRRIKRLYLYNFYGVERSARFDAGLIGPDGRPRAAYQVVKDALD